MAWTSLACISRDRSQFWTKRLAQHKLWVCWFYPCVVVETDRGKGKRADADVYLPRDRKEIKKVKGCWHAAAKPWVPSRMEPWRREARHSCTRYLCIRNNTSCFFKLFRPKACQNFVIGVISSLLLFEKFKTNKWKIKFLFMLHVGTAVSSPHLVKMYIKSLH